MDITDNPNYYFNESQYKSKYICTDCRKSFKRKILTDVSANTNTEETDPKCPECGNAISWIGPKFRAPKTDNIKAWNSICILHKIGVLNFVGWANNYVYIPETKKALHNFLIELKENYEWNIDRWMKAEYSPENKEQIKFFSDAIKKIDIHLKEK